jgi:hypothetical protein
MAFFLLSPAITFLPEGLIVGFQNFAWGINSQIELSAATSALF